MIFRATLFVLMTILAAPAHSAEPISIRGSAVVGAAVDAAAELVKETLGLEYKVVTDGGSTDAIYKVAEGVVDFALATRTMSQTERALRPDLTFKEILLGRQAVLLVVPDAIWASGIRALTREQLRRIYERDITNWKQLGGEDRALTFYNRETGHGVWDLFTIFVYGDPRKAAAAKHEIIALPGDVRTAVEFNSGAIGLLEYSELHGNELHALGIKTDDGTIITPTPENISTGRYELSRPLMLITSRNVTGKLRDFVQLMTGEKGQAFIKKSGHVTLAEMKAEAK